LVHRKGVGGTLAAAILFAVILVANFAVVASSQGLYRLSLQNNVESAAYDYSQVQSGAEALTLLGGVQSSLGHQALECTTASQELAATFARFSALVVYQGVTITERLSVGSPGPADDNMSILRPFNGSEPGWLAMDLAIGERGNFSAVGVVYSKSEVHVVSLPVLITKLLELCSDAVNALKSDLAGANFTSCEPAAIGALVARGAAPFQADASAAGFRFSTELTVDQTDGCTANLVSEVSQSDIPGPGGPFTVQVEQAYSVQVRISNS
jgi:hypothetical protein